MFQAPKRAKKLYFDVIPSAMDNYIDEINNYNDNKNKLDTTVYHIHNGNPPKYSGALKFSLLLNLVQACNTSDENILMQFISKYLKNPSNETIVFMKKLAKYAIIYYNDFIANTRKFAIPNKTQLEALIDLKKSLNNINDNVESDVLQNIIFEIGKKYYSDDLKEWFVSLYRILFGSDSGPRMGSFISLYGVENTISLIDSRIKEVK